MAIIRKKPKLVNIKYGKAYDVYIGRGSRWGNPFMIGRDGTRKDVVEKHKEWLHLYIQHKKRILKYGYDNRWVIEHLDRLKGKTLGCYCWPLSCHGNTLIDLISIRKKL